MISNISCKAAACIWKWQSMRSKNTDCSFHVRVAISQCPLPVTAVTPYQLVEDCTYEAEQPHECLDQNSYIFETRVPQKQWNEMAKVP